MTQNKLNNAVSSCLEELADAMKIASNSRDILMKLLVFEGNRIDRIENKIDILMTERAENEIDRTHYKQPLTEEESFLTNADNVNKAKSIFEDAIDEHLEKDDGIEGLGLENMLDELNERVKEMFPEELNESLDDITQTEITPKALVALGFEENYQGVDMGNPGYIYYTLYILDVEFISTTLEDEGPFHVMFGNEGQFSICNLRKLEDLLLSLEEVS